MADHDDHHDDKHSGGHGGGHAHAAGGHGDGEHEGAPEWLISFADNVTLMMAFFVILLAMNLKEPTTGGIGGTEQNPSAGSAGALDLSIAIRSAFNNPVDMNSNNPYEQALVRRLRERAAAAQGATGNADHQGPRGDYDSVQAQAPTDYYTPSGVVHFAFGSSDLSAVAHDEIQQIAAEVQDLTYVIEVRGHASPYEVFRNEREGFRFSFDRADAVANALVAAGIPADNLRVVACSDGVPLGERARTREEGEQWQVVEVVTTGEPVKPRTAMPANGGGGR